MDELKPCPGVDLRDVHVMWKAVNELEDMAFHESMKKHLSAETLAIAITAICEKAERARHENAETRRAAPENKALTVEQLRKMGGEPVWIVIVGEAMPPMCEIVVESGKNGIKLANAEITDDYGDFDLYGKTWLAYARKPEGSEAT
jgi:hypothetical protein